MTRSERLPTVGYVVSTWPRLSQTFVLREILAVERLGVPVRIFSAKDPDGEPSHGDDFGRHVHEVTFRPF